MTQQLGIVKGDDLQRLGSLGFIIGSVLLIFFNALALLDVDIGSIPRVVSAFFVSAGLLGLMLGMAAIYRSITAAGAGWARLGFYILIVGTTIWLTHMSMRAGTARAAAEGLTDGVAAMDVMRRQVHAMSVLTEWLAIFFVGIGMVRSAVYPRWLGWTGLILGILTIALGGVPLFFLGPGSAVEILFGVLAGLTAIWALIVGIWIARRTW